VSVRRRAPAFHVLDAFGVDRGSLHPLEGGQNHTWRAEDMVLRAGVEPRMVAWLGHVAERVDAGELLRLASPVRARDGRWVVGGWGATTWQAGVARPDCADALLPVAADLERALASADLEWPGFLRARTDATAAADRVAWGEEPLPRFARRETAALLERLEPVLRRPRNGAPAQVVHANLAINVLFDEEGVLPPAVIDLAPLWRPAGFGAAVALADAIARHGARSDAAVALVAADDGRADLLARAVAFRVVANPGDVERYAPVAEIALRESAARSHLT
jgi:uncharacterized protein (TIGR02569 family)